MLEDKSQCLGRVHTHNFGILFTSPNKSLCMSAAYIYASLMSVRLAVMCGLTSFGVHMFNSDKNNVLKNVLLK